MWSLLSRKLQLLIVVAAAFLTLRVYDWISAFFGGEPLSTYKSITIAVFLVGTVLVLFANWCWRPIWRQFPALERAIAPDLNGEWAGTIISTWIDPDTNAPRPPVPIQITIEQSLLKVSVSLRAPESGSQSGRAFLERRGRTGCYRLWYDYRNDPKAQFQHRSTSHDGFAYLEIDISADRDHLEGFYYTARRTTGDVDVRRAVRSAPQSIRPLSQ